MNSKRQRTIGCILDGGQDMNIESALCQVMAQVKNVVGFAGIHRRKSAGYNENFHDSGY
jgi:hypothetical protein